MSPRTLLALALAAALVGVALFRDRQAAVHSTPTADITVAEEVNQTGERVRHRSERFNHRPRIRAPIHNDIASQVQDKLRDWKAEPDREARDRLMQELLALLTDENAAEIAQSLSAEDLGEHFGIAALERWLTSDPRIAAEWLSSRPETTAGQAALVARKLLSTNGNFQNYLNQMAPTEWKDKILTAAGFETAATNPLQAIAFAKQMKPGESRTALLQSSAFEWARTDPTSAMNWVAQVEDPALREQLAAWSAKGFASADPEKAAAWLVASVKNPELLVDAAQSVVRSWAASSPAAAADWIAQFPDGSVQDEALETLMSFWSTTDSSGAWGWIHTLPEGDLRAKASSVLARATRVVAGGGDNISP